MQNSFGIQIIPGNDDARINALEKLHILDTNPEDFFDNLAKIVARCMDMPIALISLVDKERVFFKANVGMPGVQNIPRGISLCSLAILEPQPTVFNDALKEPCLLANPLVVGSFGLRFYAGAPITTEDGFHIGTVCVLDLKPREFSKQDKELLARFADSVMKAIVKKNETLHETISS